MRHLGWILCAFLAVSGPVLAQGGAGNDPAAATAATTDQTAEPAAEPEQAEEPATPATVEERLDEIDQKLRVLGRQGELDKETAAEKAKTATSVTSGRDGFSLRSADGAYQFRLRGYTQFDGRFFQDDEERPGVDTFLLRRVRPIFEGTVFKIFDFRIMPDFGGGQTVLQDAYIDGRFKPGLRVRAGKFKPPVGLERLQSGTDILFVERALPTNLVPNRDLGVQLFGDFSGGAIAYQVGVFNGVPDGGSGDLDSNDGKDLAGRVFFQPFIAGTSVAKNLGFGIAASTGEQEGTVAAPGLPTLRTQAQQTFFGYRTDGTAAGTTIADGDRTRVSPQLYWYTSRFGILSEYVVSQQEVTRGAVTEELEHDSWQVAASFTFGGSPSFRGVQVKKPFDPAAGGWGALEIKARVAELDVDDDAFPLFASPTSAASLAESWGLGLNWYLNRSLRVYLDYEETSFEGGAAAGTLTADRPDEKILFSRFQISF